MPNFNFRASAFPQVDTTPVPVPQAPVQGMDMMAIFAQLLAAQSAQNDQRQQQGREFQGGIRRDMSGNPIDPTNRAGSLTGEAEWRKMFPQAPGNVTASVPQAPPVAPPPAPFTPQPGGLGFTGPTPQPQYGPNNDITNMDAMQQQYRDFYRPGGATPYMQQPQQKKKRTGASYGGAFGASASPRPGFGF